MLLVLVLTISQREKVGIYMPHFCGARDCYLIWHEDSSQLFVEPRQKRNVP